LARFAPQLLSILRIVAAFMFMLHGTGKLFHFPAEAGAAPMNLEMFSLPWTAGVFECFGGFLLLIGLATRPIAFLLAGEMAVAYFKVHAKVSFWPTLNHGELAALYSFVWLYFAAAGAGPWSVDAAMRKGDT
jgi:putative oxidoreductase